MIRALYIERDYESYLRGPIWKKKYPQFEAKHIGQDRIDKLASEASVFLGWMCGEGIQHLGQRLSIVKLSRDPFRIN